MKTIVKFYEQHNIITSIPKVPVENNEVKAITDDKELQDYCDARNEYCAFWEEVKDKANRKRRRYLKRKSLFSKFDNTTEMGFEKLVRKIKIAKIQKLPSIDVEIKFLKSGEKNMPHFIRAIELDLNVGGISPQLYSLGLKGYTIL